jgi:hypothetical protein
VAARGRLVLFGLAASALCGLGCGRDAKGKRDLGRASANEYIGADKCRACHAATASGNQYDVWVRSRHSKAFESLGSAKAREFARERGVEDARRSDKCLKCHVTGFGRPRNRFKNSFDPHLGVQCESCHGPGDDHVQARFAAVAGGQAQPAYTPVEEWEIIRSPPAQTCLECHNEESPAYVPFCFHEFMDRIRHLNPRKPRTETELPARMRVRRGRTVLEVSRAADTPGKPRARASGALARELSASRTSPPPAVEPRAWATP